MFNYVLAMLLPLNSLMMGLLIPSQCSQDKRFSNLSFHRKSIFQLILSIYIN